MDDNEDIIMVSDQHFYFSDLRLSKGENYQIKKIREEKRIRTNCEICNLDFAVAAYIYEDEITKTCFICHKCYE